MKTEIKIDSLAYQGYGVGRAEGKVWFVPYTHPGDLISAEAVKEKKSFVHGKMTELITPSPDRIPPECPLFGKCGGCQWQILSYPAQIKAKKSILEDIMKRSGIELTTPPEVRESPSTWGYRNRIQMRFAPSGHPGFYRAESKEIIPVSACPLAEDDINYKLSMLLAGLKKEPESLKKKYPHGFELRLPPGGRTEIRSLAEREGSPRDFSQVNSKVNLILQKEVKACLDDIDLKKNDFNIMDLYCGDGNLSLPLAERASKIIGWDGSKAAVKWGNRKAAEIIKARVNGGTPGGTAIEYRTGYLEKCRKDIKKEARGADILILDPPRRGIKGLEELIGGLGIGNIIYVSCSPPDLARDLKSLKRFGYGIEKTILLDMFPQTYHMEVMVRLRKK